MAFIISASIAYGSFSLWTAFKAEDKRVISAAFKEQESLVGEKISQYMNQAVVAVKRMADRWEAQGGTSYELWQKDAANYINDFPALKALNLTKSDLHIKWIEPVKGNESALGLYIAFDKDRETALMKAKELNKSTITPPIDLVQGYKAIIIYTPVYIDGVFDGFINAIYNPLAFLDARLPQEFDDNFEMIVKDGDTVIFQTDGAEGYVSQKESSTSFDLLEREWTLTLKAKENFIRTHESHYAYITIFGGIFCSFLGGLLAYITILSKQQNNLLKKQKKKLVNKEKEQDKLLEELAGSNEELARFAYVCSHDLQEPLRMVQSFSQKLERHLGNSLQDDERGQLYFKFVIDGAKRSQILIREILAYSEIDRDTNQIEKVNLNDIINVVKTNLSAPLDIINGKITYDPLPTIEGNKTQIYQLMQNLVNNGLKYQEPDEAPHIHISAEDLGHNWGISVKDNGIGIDPKYHNKIFEVFQRLHRRTEYAGTGIGLSICKKVVEKHKGKLSVSSAKGQGSTFTFTIPKVQSVAIAA